ncbi:hypothetical protein AO268_01135 [Pseudomonas sp. ICMP 8385]|nr:hypothetical protein AO268_01135 [Pseudomonas sp. ICMP 8385]
MFAAFLIRGLPARRVGFRWQIRDGLAPLGIGRFSCSGVLILRAAIVLKRFFGCAVTELTRCVDQASLYHIGSAAQGPLEFGLAIFVRGYECRER